MRWSGLLNDCLSTSCQGGSTAFSRVCDGVADHVVNTQTGTTSSVQAGSWVMLQSMLEYGQWLAGCEKHYLSWAEATEVDFQHTQEVACISSADQFWDAGSELRSIPSSSAKLTRVQVLQKYFWTWVVALEVFFLFALMCKGKGISAAVACTKRSISGTLLHYTNANADFTSNMMAVDCTWLVCQE